MFRNDSNLLTGDSLPKHERVMINDESDEIITHPVSNNHEQWEFVREFLCDETEAEFLAVIKQAIESGWCEIVDDADLGKRLREVAKKGIAHWISYHKERQS